MPYLTMRKKSKATTKPLFSRLLYDIQPGNGVGLFWETHSHIYLLTYFPPDPHGEDRVDEIKEVNQTMTIT